MSVAMQPEKTIEVMLVTVPIFVCYACQREHETADSMQRLRVGVAGNDTPDWLWVCKDPLCLFAVLRSSSDSEYVCF